MKKEGRKGRWEAETTRVLCCGLYGVDDRARAQGNPGGDRGSYMTHDIDCFGADLA